MHPFDTWSGHLSRTGNDKVIKFCFFKPRINRIIGWTSRVSIPVPFPCEGNALPFELHALQYTIPLFILSFSAHLSIPDLSSNKLDRSPILVDPS